MSTIAIVDDHKAFSERLAAFVQGQHGCTVVGYAEDAVSGLRLVTAIRPDIALVDVGLPGEDGFWLCRRITERRLGVAVILMSQQGDGVEYAEAAKNSGAIGYLPKTALTRDMPGLLRSTDPGGEAARATDSRSAAVWTAASPVGSPTATRLGRGIASLTAAPVHRTAVAGGLGAAVLAYGELLGQPAVGLAGAAGAVVLSQWQYARPRTLLRPCGGSGAVAGVLRPSGTIPSLPSGRAAGLRQSGGAPEERSVMQWFIKLGERIVREDEGQDMVEYALILGLVSVIAVVAVTATGASVNTIWTKVSAAVSAAASKVP